MVGCDYPHAAEFLCLTKQMTLTRKTSATLQAMLVFFIISHPLTYKITDSLLGGLVGRLVAPCGCSTTLGLLIHTVVFGGVVLLLMKTN